MPTIRVSSTRKAIMYSLTRVRIAVQLAPTQIGVSSVDSSTNRIEMPSTPMWYEMLNSGSQSALSTNWNSEVPRSKPNQMKSDSTKVMSEVHSAT